MQEEPGDQDDDNDDDVDDNDDDDECRRNPETKMMIIDHGRGETGLRGQVL